MPPCGCRKQFLLFLHLSLQVPQDFSSNVFAAQTEGQAARDHYQENDAGP
jgi:hypothetical protein